MTRRRTRPPVGIVGYGLLGAAFAWRLHDAGRPVLAYDPQPARVTEMCRAGIRPARSVDVLSRECTALVVAVYSADQVADVLDAIAAVAPEHRAPGLTVLLTTTVSPDAVPSLAERAHAAGVGLIELPVSGTSAEIADGRGLGLVGAERAQLKAHRALIETLTPEVAHVGPVGTAARMKLAVNLVLELNRSALAEGMRLAELMGLDAADYLATLRRSAAQARVHEAKGEKILRGDFAAEGRAAQSLKDVELMLELARRHGQSLPLAGAQAELLARCVAAGDGDLDGVVVIQELRRSCAAVAA